MTVDSANEGASRYDPGSMPSSSFATTKARWYRRPWFLTFAAVVAIVGLSVLMDIPSRSSNQQQAADLAPQIKLINKDSQPCSYAVKETLRIYHDAVAHALSAEESSQANKLLTDDQTACSFASGPLYDLTNNIDIGYTRAGIPINHLLTTVTTWASSDALAAVNDIKYLYVHPGDQSTLHDLSKQLQLLSEDRARAIRDVKMAEAILHHSLPLPSLPKLPGTVAAI
jgi:hypothetical protein